MMTERIYKTYHRHWKETITAAWSMAHFSAVAGSGGTDGATRGNSTLSL